ncbi:bifunctional 2-polyprenyl-6-hydroxyphenol methylase/3-demethylubiquinol 3-O-methyltransferase UbiG [Phenylobacterium sp. Root700]|uniref:class I SAM-dependent methyltransferase n=1 Tax=Phenylobacterium sp. Root700 TaxID=1736591 RepID=UPI0006FC1EE2|nr:methyltransferase domain-containing protein [Phenylobacterium sp. Root700]KRB52642.1 methyltransferase [Phenylobacterium sp. Root700]
MDRVIYDRMREVQRDHWWFAARREILADQIARLALPAGAEILEAGCGAGGNLEMLAQFGKVRAIEPDEASRAYAAQGGIEVRGGLLPGALPAYEQPFDLVVAFDVIEHVDEDAASVAALAALLAPGGRLMATVPANAWMWSQHDVLHHHKRRYDLAGFRQLFDDAGLIVEKASYFNMLLFPAISAVRLLKHLTRNQKGDDDAMPSAAANAALRKLFASEKALLSRFDLPFGVSILLTARRPT